MHFDWNRTKHILPRFLFTRQTLLKNGVIGARPAVAWLSKTTAKHKCGTSSKYVGHETRDTKAVQPHIKWDTWSPYFHFFVFCFLNCNPSDGNVSLLVQTELYQGCMVTQWVALVPHGKKVLSLIPGWVELAVLFVCVCFKWQQLQRLGKVKQICGSWKKLGWFAEKFVHRRRL